MRMSNDFIAKGVKCVVQERSNMEDGLPYFGTVIGIDSEENIVYVWDEYRDCVSWTHANCVYTSADSIYEVMQELEKFCARYQRRVSRVNLKRVQSQRVLDKYLRSENDYLKQDFSDKHLKKMAGTFEELAKQEAEYTALCAKMEALYTLMDALNNFTEDEEQ